MKNPWLIAASATLAMGLVMLALDLAFPEGGIIWHGWVTEESTLVYFCEPATVKALFRQKVDTYTNLSFFFNGILVLAFAHADRRRPSVRFAVVHPVWSLWYGIALLTTFAGSTFFHASLTLTGEAFDLSGVYAAVLLPGFFNLHRLGSLWARRRIAAWPFLVACGLAWLASSLLIFEVSSRVVVLGALSLIGISGFVLWLRVRPREGWVFAASSILITAVAAMFFVFDIQKIGCDPESLFQAHGLWHLLSGTAAITYYGFMRRLQ
ncbi:MAG TPA: hypothetical protein VHS96_11180 [Bacteroidia bacterium]|nr:hypothetical protein [Bacteroidia bacterium]